MPVNFRPHETILDPVSRMPVVHHLHDYVCLFQGGKRYYVQHGQVYLGGGELVPQSDLPEEFWSAYRALTPAQRRTVELELPGDHVHSLADLPSDVLTMIQSLPPEIRAQLTGSLQSSSANLSGKPEVPSEPSRMPQEPLSPDPYSEVFDREEEEEDDEPEMSFAPSLWTCDECGAQEELRKKGVHIAHHRRSAKAKARRGE